MSRGGIPPASELNTAGHAERAYVKPNLCDLVGDDGAGDQASSGGPDNGAARKAVPGTTSAVTAAMPALSNIDGADSDAGSNDSNDSEVLVGHPNSSPGSDNDGGDVSDRVREYGGAAAAIATATTRRPMPAVDGATRRAAS